MTAVDSFWGNVFVVRRVGQSGGQEVATAVLWDGRTAFGLAAAAEATAFDLLDLR